MPADSPPSKENVSQEPSQPETVTGLGQDNSPPLPQPIQAQSTAPFDPPTTVSINQSAEQPTGGKMITATSNQGGGKRSNKKVIATILGVLLLVGGVATGVFLVSQQQEIRIGAWDCRNYVFDVNNDGLVTVQNGSTRNEPAQQASVFINGNHVATLDVPALDAGDAATLGTVDIGDTCSFSWEVVGTKDCNDKGGNDKDPSLSIEQFSFTWNGPPQLSHATTTFCDGSSSGKIDYQESGSSTTATFDKDVQSVEGFGGGCTESSSRVCTQPTPTEGPTPTPAPSPTLTPTPTPPPIGASCLDVKAYDANWNLLSGFDLSDLEPGDVVRFAVAGTTTLGTFDKARFTINGTLRPEVASKKPGSEEFYDEYTFPAGVSDFSVKAQIHHTILGWF